MIAVTLPDGETVEAITVDERVVNRVPTVRIYDKPYSDDAEPLYTFLRAIVDYAPDLRSAVVKEK